MFKKFLLFTKGLNVYKLTKLTASAQKSWKTWTTYWSAGYAINSAPFYLNFFYSGWEIQKNFNSHITLGMEISYQTAATTDSLATTFLNMGGSYSFNDNLALMVSVGHNITGTDSLLGYLGFYFTGTI